MSSILFLYSIVAPVFLKSILCIVLLYPIIRNIFRPVSGPMSLFAKLKYVRTLFSIMNLSRFLVIDCDNEHPLKSRDFNIGIVEITANMGDAPPLSIGFMRSINDSRVLQRRHFDSAYAPSGAEKNVELY